MDRRMWKRMRAKECELECRCITIARDNVSDLAGKLSLITNHAAEMHLPKEPDLLAAIINMRMAAHQLDTVLQKRGENNG